MQSVIDFINIEKNIRTIVLDILLFTFIFFLPAISHLLAFPLYYFDPMKIVLVIGLLHSSKKNALLIAIGVPLFSFLVSSHPSILKTGLLTIELILVFALYFILLKQIHNRTLAVLFSIVISKVVYYSLKYLAINAGALEGSLIATPFIYQTISILLISIYAFVISKKFLGDEKS